MILTFLTYIAGSIQIPITFRTSSVSIKRESIKYKTKTKLRIMIRVNRNRLKKKWSRRLNNTRWKNHKQMRMNHKQAKKIQQRSKSLSIKRKKCWRTFSNNRRWSSIWIPYKLARLIRKKSQSRRPACCAMRPLRKTKILYTWQDSWKTILCLALSMASRTKQESGSKHAIILSIAVASWGLSKEKTWNFPALNALKIQISSSQSISRTL